MNIDMAASMAAVSKIALDSHLWRLSDESLNNKRATENFVNQSVMI
jgi:hypothetical protein